MIIAEQKPIQGIKAVLSHYQKISNSNYGKICVRKGKGRRWRNGEGD
jgi:hypothetical protein